MNPGQRIETPFLGAGIITNNMHFAEFSDGLFGRGTNGDTA